MRLVEAAARGRPPSVTKKWEGYSFSWHPSWYPCPCVCGCSVWLVSSMSVFCKFLFLMYCCFLRVFHGRHIEGERK
jgi:hypothetical protein